MTTEMGVSAHDRRRQIAGFVLEEGRVTVADLALRFGVTDVSIRRDLAILEGSAELRRVHGGAVSTSRSRRDGAYLLKARENRDVKARIGAAAAMLVRAGDIAVFDSGSTVAQVARHIAPSLRRASAITAVTNSMPVMREISTWDGPHLVCLGGLYLPDHEALVGPQTIAEMRDLSADIAFIGCDGLTSETGLTTPHVLIAEIGSTIVSRSRRVVAVADSTKLGRRGFTPIVPLSAIDLLVTDTDAGPADLEWIRRAGIEVVTA